jgi:penicillin-binding protein 1A
LSNFLIKIKKASIVDNQEGNPEPYQQDSSPLPEPENSNAANTPKRRISLLQGLAVSITTSVIIVLLAALYVKSLIPDTPDTDALLQARYAQPSVIFSADGTQLAVFKRAHQERVTLEQISPYVTDALIATEDHRFYEHQGVDIGRTVSAIFHTAGGDAQGGSTITQQLARNLFPEQIGNSRTLDRKLKEIITARKIERTYSKQQILETYLNTVPFLYNVVGIEMAARTYFGKPASKLDELESATLVGMLKGTRYYNPVINPERAQKRRNVVLAQMVKRNMLAEARYLSLRDQPLRVELNRPAEAPNTAPHFTAHLRKWLTDWAGKNGHDLYTDGLIIHSTLDDELQQAATQAVERQTEQLQNIADVEWSQKSPYLLSHAPSTYARMRKKLEPFRHFWEERPELEQAFIRETAQYKKAIAAGQSDLAALAKLKSDSKFISRLRTTKTRLEAGFVAMDPASGAIKAWVGSRDFDLDQFDHVAQAERQPGSTFKPIVYGAAMELGLRSSRAYRDSPVEIRSVDGSIWRPTDMSGTSGRAMSMREGLIYSKNTITAQVMLEAGLPNIISLAHDMGINQSRLDPVPSLALGTSPVTLLEMVSAYSTIAQAGEYRAPVFIKRITDRDGKMLAEFGAESRRAMSEDTAVELIDMMRGVVRHGTGQAIRNRFGIAADIAGKTGTTQNNTDGWFILMHPDLVAGTWVGFNDARITMRSNHWGQGGHNAILVVGDFFRDTLKAKRIDVKARFPQPRRAAPMMVKAPPDDWFNQPNNHPDNGWPPPGYGVITRSDSGSSVIIGPHGTQTVERNEIRSLPAEVYGRIMRELEHDPTPGGSRGGSDAEGSSGNSEPERQPSSRGRNPARSERDLLFEWPDALRR